MPASQLMAILSLIFGIVGLVLSFIPCVCIASVFLTTPGIVLGVIALVKAIKNHAPGKGCAIAGLACCLASHIVFPISYFATQNFLTYRNESQTEACISNMKQILCAAESWLTRYPDKTPTMNDLCGSGDKYIKQEPTCPKDGSRYIIERDDVSGSIKVSCGSGDPNHVLRESW